jgi:hypothetical protein
MTRRSAVVILAVVLGTLPAALATGTPAAWAFVTAGGAGRSPVTVGTLAAPTDVTATFDAGAVDVTWSAVSPPGPATLGYVVTRTEAPSGPTVDVCGSPSEPLADSPTSCSDGGTPDGTYSYSVTAVYASWTTSGVPSDPVEVGGATTTTTLAPSSSTATYGAEDGVSYEGGVTADGSGVASGTVDVTAGPTYLCTVTLPDTSCSSDPDALDPSDTPYPVIATFSGGGGTSASVSSTQELTVYAAPVITTTSLAPATAGETGYTQVLTATGGMPDLTWSQNGAALPTGLTLDSDTGVISGTLDKSDATTLLSFSVTDANGAVGSASLTLTVTTPFVQQISGHTSSDATSVALTLVLPVVHGDTLVLSLAQACLTSADGAVDSPVASVSGGSVTWVRATATGCSGDGDAELWYGLDAAGAASGAKVTVSLSAAAPVQFANVAEYTGVAAHDGDGAATSASAGTSASTGPGTVSPTTAGELVVSTTFVTQSTPHVVSTLVGPFVALNPVTPYQGLGVYAVDATTAALTPSYTQTTAGVPATGPWSSVATAFTFNS